ncbi:MAG: bifunctional DNA-formamidopyrimidine glycosylase/DNA-(apurinic or apyrimidinic site) lyase [Comamonadaceae bacterium]|nr:bifunctional DNA-formamidopyrimidine glycosylase/DNA-(apurinic or apyrimidinic site) lyase [Comamonadaceae bacterium]
MPELPEVEVTRRGVASRVQGARILAVRLGKPLRWPLGMAPGALAGQTVTDVGRRGKYLLLHLAPGGVLLVHLGMSGSLGFWREPPAPGPHDHFDLLTTAGVLRLHDPRRFGAVVWSPHADTGMAAKLLGKLGMEPLSADFDPARFHAGLRRRQAPVKQVLLGGDLVVGVGNIYASEALFMAGIRPTVAASRLSRPRADRLHAAIREVLARAVTRGGSTLRDFVGVDGNAGHFQLESAVYGRAGQPCRACGAPIRRLIQGQRATYYCPACQKA